MKTCTTLVQLETGRRGLHLLFITELNVALHTYRAVFCRRDSHVLR